MNTQISRRRFIAATGTGSVTAAAAMLGATTTQANAASHQSVKNATLVSIEKPAGKSHTFVTNNDGRVTIQILEGPTGSILMDSGDAPEYSAEARAFAESLGKPIEAVLLSHDHPDHTGGLPSFTGLPIFTTSGILSNIQNGPFPKPDNLAEVKALDDTEVSFGGLNLRIHTYKDAEAAEQIIVEAPEMGTAILQDLVYNNAYFFPGMNRVNWIDVLSDLRSKLDVETLLVGHGYPSSQGELTAAIDYLSEYNDMVASSSGPDELVTKMKERWPNRMAQGILDLQGFAFR
ncbi:MAG: MBL fold metallo-hydrolase [Rhizobiaceae bacterium]|nr:MBL fold metallo-hydrolase [Rhizobiaceae bacterium]